MDEKTFFKIKIAVIIIIIIGYSIYIITKNLKKEKKEKFPKIIAKCPDYWEIVDNNKCKNIKKIGKCNIDDNSIMEFKDDIYKNRYSNYFKCQWAKNCGVSWHGIDSKC